MKRTAYNLIIAAAAVLAAVTTGSAQSLKAEIPFPFVANGARMQPGSYSMTMGRLGGSGTTVQIYNVDDRHSILTLPQMTDTSWKHPESKPVLTFACTDGRCVLVSMRDDQSRVYSFRSGKTGPGTRIATVALRSDRTE